MHRQAGRIEPSPLKPGARLIAGLRKRPLLPSLLGIALATMSAPAIARGVAFDHFIHTELEAKDGLPAQANSIVQTPDGYLWFGTPDGLYRYNGQSFERIPIARRGGFVDATIIEAIVTRRGEMWLGLGQNSGVAVLHGSVVHQSEMEHPPPQITHLVEDARGIIWAASSGKDKRLFRQAGSRWQQVDLRLGLPPGAIADVECDRQGTIWVSLFGSNGGTLAFLRAGGSRFEIASDRIGLGRLALDPSGGLWISDNFGTRLLRDANGRPPARAIAYPLGANIGFPRIRFDREGNLWGSSLSGGMFLIPDAGNPANAGTRPQTFDDNHAGMASTLDVFPDREGNIWISSSESLHRFHPANVVPVPGIASHPRSPQRLAAANDGSIYLFSLGRLYRIRPHGEPHAVATDLGTNAAICTARSGGIWLLQQSRATLFDDRGQRTLPGSGARDEPILCEEDGFGRLWALGKNGVSWFRDGRWHDGFPGLGQIDLWDAAVDPSGALVLNVDANKLIRIDETSVTRLDRSWPGSITAMRNTRLGLIVSHGAGLWRAPTDERRAANLFSRALAKRRDFDLDKDYFWSFGLAGVERIAAADFAKAWQTGRAPAGTMLFNWSEGLPVGKQDIGFRGRQIMAGTDGRVWVLTRRGPYVIDNRNIVRNTIPPPLVVRTLWADGRSHGPTADAIELPGGTRSIRIAYSALSYSMPDRVQFKYRLIGTSDEWTYAGNRHDVTFGNLGPGNYRFEVAGANEDGVWNNKPAFLEFRIAPTFVQSTGFKVAVALLVLLAAALAYQWRTFILATRIRKAMSERSAERDRIARELHDTLLQSVQGLILRFQLLVDHLPAQHPSRQELFTTLDQADEVLAESRQRVLDLRARQPRSDLRSVIAALARRQLPAGQFRTEIRTAGKVVPIEPIVFNGLVDVANECLFNILRHARANTVHVEIRYEPSHLEMEIADDGVGLDPQAVSSAVAGGHFGLVGMRERMANIGGKFRLDSAPGQGVIITVRIPSSVAYRTKNAQNSLKGGGWRWFARQAQEPVGP